jgi:hypothetical protein
MIFEIDKASDVYGVEGKPCKNAKFNSQKDEWEIEINSLEELVALIQEKNYSLIISDTDITIYDSYVE